MPALRPGVLGIVAVELVAVTWLRVTTLTRYTPRADATVAAGAAAVPGSNADGRPESGFAPGPTSSAIRGLGRMTAGARNRLPEAKATVDAGARRMGGHAGRLQRAWRRASR